MSVNSTLATGGKKRPRSIDETVDLEPSQEGRCECNGEDYDRTGTGRAKRRLLRSLARLNLDNQKSTPKPNLKPDRDNGRMDTSDAFTVYVDSLDSDSDDNGHDNDSTGEYEYSTKCPTCGGAQSHTGRRARARSKDAQRLVIVPEIERKLMRVPYDILAKSKANEHVDKPSNQQQSVVLYKPTIGNEPTARSDDDDSGMELD